MRPADRAGPAIRAVVLSTAVGPLGIRSIQIATGELGDLDRGVVVDPIVAAIQRLPDAAIVTYPYLVCVARPWRNRVHVSMQGRGLIGTAHMATYRCGQAEQAIVRAHELAGHQFSTRVCAIT